MKRATVLTAWMTGFLVLPGAAMAQATPTLAPRTIGPYAPLVGTGDLVFLSGQIAIDPATAALDREATIEAQTRQVWRNIAATLATAGLRLEDVVSATVYLIDMAEFPRMNAAYAEMLGDVRPARTTVAVAALPLGARIEIAVVAARRPAP